MVTVGLSVRLIAAPGKEDEVERFLKSALPLVDDEPETAAWFAARVDSSTFLIFDVFPTESGRERHLGGPVAEALAARAAELFAGAPVIERVEVLAAKLPG